MKSNNTYHIEVLVGEDEPPENALKRFRWASKSTGVVQEARRRQHFENTQDEKKRRLKDGHMKKSKKWIPPPRFEDVVTTLESPPFADLFGEPSDIFSEGKLQPNGNGNGKKRF
ncbi:g6175 [Coccomyxa elongata]|nr:probable 30S ribosomal protein S21 at N-terminal half [Coccomyxa sp. Obi]